MVNLKIIIVSTRPGRKGPALGAWIYEAAKKYADLNVELLDLAVINLPFLDEPVHPRFQKYEHEHTKKWSAIISSADAYIIVTPEYNYGYPAPIRNALDYLYNEWTYKPVGFVSYGGVAGGTRAVQMLKQVVTAQKMMPVAESVNVPFFTKFINENGQFVPDEVIESGAAAMLAELIKWGENLKSLRTK